MMSVRSIRTLSTLRKSEPNPFIKSHSPSVLALGSCRERGPEMALTLVRRASAKLPYNHFLFRTDPKWTKNEIKEYLSKVYSVNVARITTYISPGDLKRVPGRRDLYRTKTHKKVYVRVADDSPAPVASTEMR